MHEPSPQEALTPSWAPERFICTDRLKNIQKHETAESPQRLATAQCSSNFRRPLHHSQPVQGSIRTQCGCTEKQASHRIVPDDDTRPRAACGKGSLRRCLDLSYSNLKFAPAGGFGRPLGIRRAYGPFTGDSHPTYTSEPRHTHSYQLQVQVNGIRARRVRNSSRYPTNPKFTAIKEKAEHSERRYRGLVTSLCCLEYCVLDSLAHNWLLGTTGMQHLYR